MSRIDECIETLEDLLKDKILNKAERKRIKVAISILTNLFDTEGF